MEGLIRIRQLEVLNAITDHNSMTKAAESLVISQSAGSRLLANFAKNLGLELFYRGDGRITSRKKHGFFCTTFTECWNHCHSLMKLADTYQCKKLGTFELHVSQALSLVIFQKLFENF